MIQIDAIELLDFDHWIGAFPDHTQQAAMMAINQVADRDGRASIKRDILQQLAFKPSYLNEERLGVRQKATKSRLEAIVRGRDRPTSLARFVVGGERALMSRLKSKRKNAGEVRVQVKVGRTTPIKNAFAVRLKNGNVGLAVRTKNPMRNSRGAVPLGRGAYLLYAPSVDQAMKTLIPNKSPRIADSLMVEFNRQLTRLIK